MKNTAKIFILLVLVLAVTFAFAACKGGKGDTDETVPAGPPPILRLDIEAYTWEISYDEGESWTALQENAGVGIADVVVTVDGRLEATLTDGTVCIIETPDTTCKHEAENIETTVTSPTCEEEGYTTYKCLKCGLLWLNNYTPASGHHFYERYCEFCGVEEPFGEIERDISWYNTSDKAFTLKDKEDLAGLAYLVNISGNNFSGKTIYLAKDIDLSGYEWVPIGTADMPFAGTFNGKYFSVMNLKISTAAEYVGFFGKVTGVITNFGVKNACISIADAGQYVGMAVGHYANGGAIGNITVGGYIEAPNCNYVGGIAGYASISNAAYTELSNTGSVSGADYVGGLFGQLAADSPNLTKLSNTGSVSGANYVGGLFGQLTASAAKLTDSSNTGAVTAAEFRAGGIAGYAGTATLTNVSNASAVSGKAYVGGLVGEGTVTFASCANKGSTVEATGYYQEEANYYAYLGGYMGKGYCYGISDCENTVSLNYNDRGYYIGGFGGYVMLDSSSRTYKNVKNSAEILGQSYVGGLFGYLYANVDIGYQTPTITMEKVTNDGNVTAIADYAGGIAGRIYLNNAANTYIQGAFNYRMSATWIENTGNITGKSYSAGMFGLFYSDGGSVLIDSKNSGVIKAETVAGEIYGEQTNLNITSTETAA